MSDIYKYYHDRTALGTVLRQRGFVWSAAGDMKQVIRGRIERSPDAWRDFVGRSTARKLLRRLAGADAVPRQDLLGICDAAALDDYVQRLKEFEVVRETADGLALIEPVNNFGPTFEWYVASLMAYEFSAESEWEVSIEDIYGGGDFEPAPVSRTVCFLSDHAACSAAVYRRS